MNSFNVFGLTPTHGGVFSKYCQNFGSLIILEVLVHILVLLELNLIGGIKSISFELHKL